MKNLIRSRSSIPGRLLRKVGNAILHRRAIDVDLDKPVISFTFDDIPGSAVTNGARILEKFRARGTFYVSAKHIGQRFEGQQQCNEAELEYLLEKGHEIGCHTFDHLAAIDASHQEYSDSLKRNLEFFKRLEHEIKLESFAYPYGCGWVLPYAKKLAGNQFTSARSTLRGINTGRIDLNFLRAFPLYSNSIGIDEIKRLIERNSKSTGWLIFYTHDVDDSPSPFGCTPADLTEALRIVHSCGADVLTVKDAISKLHQNGSLF